MLSREEVAHIALLARLGLSQAEVERFQEQLSNILENFEILRQVDTEGVPPTAHTIASDRTLTPSPAAIPLGIPAPIVTLENVSRPDEVAPSFPKDQILANAPREEEGCFRVRAILE